MPVLEYEHYMFNKMGFMCFLDWHAIDEINIKVRSKYEKRFKAKLKEPFSLTLIVIIY